MTLSKHMKAEEAAGRYCGSKLIQKSAEKFAHKYGWSVSSASALAQRVYEGKEGFDGEPVSADYMVLLMKKLADRGY